MTDKELRIAEMELATVIDLLDAHDGGRKVLAFQDVVDAGRRIYAVSQALTEPGVGNLESFGILDDRSRALSIYCRGLLALVHERQWELHLEEDDLPF